MTPWKERIKIRNCRICGAIGASFNFNGLSCESCKTFFRRNAFKQIFPCPKPNGCFLESSNRRKCSRCRLNRCFTIGMRRELIWRRGYEPAKIGLSNFVIEKYTKLQVLKGTAAHVLTPHQEALLQAVQRASSEFYEESDLKIVDKAKNLIQALTTAQNYIFTFVKYCKSFDHFKCLSMADQLALLKSSYVAILNVRFAFAYNWEKNQYPIMADKNGKYAILVDNSILYQWNKRDMPIRFIKFQQTLNVEMENDSTIRNLLMVQLLYKPDKAAMYKNGESLRYQYFLYCHILLKYLETKYQCYIKARIKYKCLTHALSTIQYQVDIHRNIFKELCLGKVDPVHMEIFGLN